MGGGTRSVSLKSLGGGGGGHHVINKYQIAYSWTIGMLVNAPSWVHGGMDFEPVDRVSCTTPDISGGGRRDGAQSHCSNQVGLTPWP